MDIGRQSLVLNDFAAQARERVALLARKRSAQICFVRDDNLRKFCQCAFPLLRENELGMAPVLCAAPPFDQTFVREFVD
jgi:hypothetical protein